MRNDSTATLASIGALAGVSKTTVSLVLNGKAKEQKIPESTIKKIEKMAEKSGYHPNHVARSLSCGETKCLGYICGDIYPRLLSQFIDAAETRGYRLNAMLTKWNPQRETECVEAALAQMVDGLIVGTDILALNDGLRKELLKKKTPGVLLGGDEKLGFPIVSHDFQPGIKAAFDELVAKGHRSAIAFLIGKDTGKRSPYVEECEAHGLKASIIGFDDKQPKSDIENACDKIASLRPDALIVEGAVICMELLKGLEKRGVKAPEGISPVCISGDDWLDYYPGIAIIDYDTLNLANKSVEALVSLIDGKEVHKRQFCDTFLRRSEEIPDRNALRRRKT